jgi:hypothetical protein
VHSQSRRVITNLDWVEPIFKSTQLLLQKTANCPTLFDKTFIMNLSTSLVLLLASTIMSAVGLEFQRVAEPLLSTYFLMHFVSCPYRTLDQFAELHLENSTPLVHQKGMEMVTGVTSPALCI